MDSTSSPPQFKNRKTGLVVFGILTILGGCVCALFALLMIVMPMLTPPSRNTQATLAIFPALMYGALAVGFIWLGIGSTLGRRWARAFLAVLSWLFLLWGVCGLAFFGTMAPRMKEAMAAAHSANQPPLPESAGTVMIIVIFCFMTVFAIVGPLIWALFYSGRNAKATCELMDPVPRWTDRSPLPVLAISLWLLIAALGVLSMSIFYPLAPLFGVLTTGATARMYHLVLGMIWLYSAWSLYRLDIRGWWIALIATMVSVISGVMTFSRHDTAEIYALLGYPAEQIAILQKMGTTNWITTWSTVIWSVPVIIYLLYIRKFFRAAKPAPADP